MTLSMLMPPGAILLSFSFRVDGLAGFHSIPGLVNAAQAQTMTTIQFQFSAQAAYVRIDSAR
jgi:hypothetical protein